MPRIPLRVRLLPRSTLSRIQGDLDVRVPRRSARARASVRRWPWSSRRGRSVQVSQADQDGRPSGAARAAIDLSVVRGVGSSMVVPRSVGSYRPVIAGAKLREGTTTILPRGGERSRESACLQCAFTPLAGARRRQRWTRSMVHGKNRIPYWIDRRLTGLAGREYGATISFGLPFELGDYPYGKARVRSL